MQTRLDYGKAAPGSVQAMYKLQKYVDQSGLDHSLLELIKTRVSQMNGCAYCIDMHTKVSVPSDQTMVQTNLPGIWALMGHGSLLLISRRADG